MACAGVERGEGRVDGSPNLWRICCAARPTARPGLAWPQAVCVIASLQQPSSPPPRRTHAFIAPIHFSSSKHVYNQFIRSTSTLLDPKYITWFFFNQYNSFSWLLSSYIFFLSDLKFKVHCFLLFILLLLISWSDPIV